MLLLLTILAYILILWIELPRLIKNRWYKEMVVFGILFALAVFLSMAQYYQLPIFNPFTAIIPLFEK
ncbi:MAG: hypothetical protein ABFC94_09815 [Syntrophomonas sp.]